MFTDFEDFKSDISSFIKPADNVKVTDGTVITSIHFAESFPTLNRLINRARVLDIEINNIAYKLYSWTTGTESCGWLCKIEPASISNIELLPEHQLLLDNIGGIQESYNQPEGAFTNNQNFLFIKSECTRGTGYWTEYYHDMCENTDTKPIPVGNLISFVYEANGAQTMYDLKTKQVYLFSHDHSFDYVTFLEGQPEYTFHYINGVNNFIDYTEMLANQWTNHLENRLPTT